MITISPDDDDDDAPLQCLIPSVRRATLTLHGFSPSFSHQKTKSSSRKSPKNLSRAQREFSSSTLVCLLRVPPPLCSPTLMSQSPLIADFTRPGPIVAHGGRDLDRSSQEKAGRGGRRGGARKRIRREREGVRRCRKLLQRENMSTG